MVLAEKESSSLYNFSPWPVVGKFALELPKNATAGDRVVLWRRAPVHGVVAVGSVVEQRWKVSGSEIRELVEVQFSNFMLSAPIALAELIDCGLESLVAQASDIDTGRFRQAIRSRRILLPDRSFECLMSLTVDRSAPLEGPSAWSLQPGDTLDRAQVHQTYGGQRSRSACFVRHSANALVFLPVQRSEGPWSSHWESRVLVTPVAEQMRRVGDRVNAPVLHHVEHGSPLRVFETLDADRCRYLGEFVIDHDDPIPEWRDTRVVEYQGGQLVQHSLPVFRLKCLEAVLGESPELSLSTRIRNVGLRVTVVDAPAPHHSQQPSTNEGQLAFGGVAQGSAGLQNVDPNDPRAALQQLVDALGADPGCVQILSDMHQSQIVASLVQQARRQHDLDELETLVLNATTKEAALQERLEKMTWIFSGEFLSSPARRGLHVQHQMDLTLVRPDNSLHGVELKLARIANPIVRHRNGWVLGSVLSNSVGQARNYLVALDENRHQILNDLGIDTRRASITIVAGHSSFLAAEMSSSAVAETLRRNNAHDPRVRVITYDELIGNARRAWAVAAPTADRSTPRGDPVTSPA
ncbi:Shedu anti-phage system protein SduA domain-containing protein [Nocardia nova]|uniref:Shedu anti-phage system protein SduA domain-containing protein n=1 Tax=Nocardia nova TaxID=37330 RepID=UPI0033F4F0EC